MRSLHLFAGAGGGLLGDLILGHTPIGAVEIDPYCCSVLRARRNDGWFPGLRVHEQDIRLFDPSEYAGRVDIVAGGFPCQDISVAGKGAGITGERSGLWKEFARIIGEIRPRYAFIENSPMLSHRGLHVVLGDLAALGFDAEWAVISAAQAGAPHRRERIWILAHARRQHGDRRESIESAAVRAASVRIEEVHHAQRCGEVGECAAMANAHRVRQLQPQGREYDEREWAGDGSQSISDTDDPRSQGRGELGQSATEWQAAPQGGHDVAGCGRGLGREHQSGVGMLDTGLPTKLVPGWWDCEPDVGRVASGVKNRVGQLKAIGNAQVPLQAALAWRLLAKRHA